MNEATVYTLAEALPYLAAGYGLFFLVIAFGGLSLWWQRRQLTRQAARYDILKHQMGR